MKKYIFLVLLAISCKFEKDESVKKVAMLMPVVKEGLLTIAQKEIIRGALTKVLTNTEGYRAITSAEMDDATTKHEIDLEDKDQRISMQQLSGADIICYTTVTKVESDIYYVEVSLIDIKTGSILNTAVQYIKISSKTEMQAGCIKLAENLIGTGSYRTGEIKYKPKFGRIKTEMVFVQGGSYLMGCDDEQYEGIGSGTPAHNVIVGSFYISKTEVTVAEFAKFIDETGYITDAEEYEAYWKKHGKTEMYSERQLWYNDNYNNIFTNEYQNKHPVACVSWKDAVAYCKWIGGRLPTEAEWEYAARGGNKSENCRYAGSDDINEVAWYVDNSENVLHPIGSKKPNELGIYDMSGNVAEWCSDWYDENYYSNSPINNPKGTNTGEEVVFRGGSAGNFDSYCTVTIRLSYFPVESSGDIGFRVVISD